jgi:hypothetical protein
MNIFELTSENLSGLGGPMGTERTSINYQKPFADLQKAKDFAIKEYGKEIEWRTNTSSGKDDGLRSDDLGYVMYYIKETELG